MNRFSIFVLILMIFGFSSCNSGGIKLTTTERDSIESSLEYYRQRAATCEDSAWYKEKVAQYESLLKED